MYCSERFSWVLYNNKRPQDLPSSLSEPAHALNRLIEKTLPMYKYFLNLPAQDLLQDSAWVADLAYVRAVWAYSSITGKDVFPYGLHTWPPDKSMFSDAPETAPAAADSARAHADRGPARRIDPPTPSSPATPIAIPRGRLAVAAGGAPGPCAPRPPPLRIAGSSRAASAATRDAGAAPPATPRDAVTATPAKRRAEPDGEDTRKKRKMKERRIWNSLPSSKLGAESGKRSSAKTPAAVTRASGASAAAASSKPTPAKAAAVVDSTSVASAAGASSRRAPAAGESAAAADGAGAVLKLSDKWAADSAAGGKL